MITFKNYIFENKKIKWDFFSRSMTKGKVDPDRVRTIRLELNTDDLQTALDKYADHIKPYRNLGQGSANTGVFEIQNDLGIYRHKSGKKIDLSTERKANNIVFKTWDELEKQEKETGEFGIPSDKW